MTWPTPPLGSLVITIVPARDKPQNLDGPIPWLRIEDFEGQYVGTSATGQGVTEETVASMNLKVFPTGTVICTCSCSMGTTAIASRPLITNQTFIGLLPRDGALNSRFLYWSLQGVRDRLNATATGAIQQYLSRDDFRQLRLPVPPPEMQRAIADYLDTEIARIDALITKKQRMIALLQEKRQETIDTEIGLFQDTVQVRRLTSNLTSGPRGWAELAGDIGSPFLRITNISRDSVELDMHEVLRVDPPSTPESRRARAQSGDVLISITADIGSVGVVSSEMSGSFFSQHLARVRPVRCDSLWLAYAIKSTLAQTQLDASQYGGTKTQLALGDIARLRVPEVGLPTQRKVAARIHAANKRLQLAAQSLASQISLIREHRLALITAAVTGELEIPGVAA